MAHFNHLESDDGYPWRRYDSEWRSLKAGALLAALVVALAFLIS
ncbi:MAG TPA: hypothetical protein VMT54_03030 [Candidatus Cybelea sp.]|nr:hypothetical protein [Candidatus Cybelea sp.]